MSLKIAINGFGRVGRLVLRAAMTHNIEVVAINDTIPIDNLAYLLKYDSLHGHFPGKIAHDSQHIIVNGKKILVFSERDPCSLPWKNLHIDYVVESTGLFVSRKEAQKHLHAGAKRVIVTSAAKELPNFVIGVNHTNYQVSDTIVSSASCTTNCLAPVAKVLVDNFGIEEGFMTTIHSVTSSQSTVDGPSKRDWRRGRCATQNIIPSSTGAAQALALCMPELESRLTAVAFRVPTANVSVVDLTVRLKSDTSYQEICTVMKAAADGAMRGILQYCEDQVVSSDFIGNTASSIFDKEAGIALNSRFFKLIAWYDNEMGYSNRVIDLAMYMASKEPVKHKT